MPIRVSHAVLITGLCLLAGTMVRAEEPSSVMSALVLPAKRTPVYVWPIMRGCKIDKPATDAVVKSLDADLRLQVHRLSLPRDPNFLSCVGRHCAELLKAEGCAERHGILVGGEVDEARCDASDKTLAGCSGQVLTRLRVFRFDLERNQAVRGDYRYALCQDQRCGAAGGAVEQTAAQLIAELMGTQSLPSPPAAPRDTPEPEARCTFNPQSPAAPASEPLASAAAESPVRTIAFAHYTQFRRLDRPSGLAEQEATARATRFTQGVTLPSGAQYVTQTVNTKHALLPGEELLGNFWRATTLHGLLVTPPAGPDFAPLRQTALDRRSMIILVLDDERKSLNIFLIEPNHALRPVSAPATCQAGGGESADCITAAVAAALLASAASPPQELSVPPTAPLAQRSLGCIPYSQRSCPECVTPAAVVQATAAPTAPMLSQVESAPSRKWTDRLLYAALGVAALTAGGLTIADSLASPLILSDGLGNSASINGLLRPAEWTAWGLAIVLAVPTAVSVFERGQRRPRDFPPPPSSLLPAAPRCPIGEEP